MKNEIRVKKGLTTQKYSKTKVVKQDPITFGWSVPFLRQVTK